MRSRVLRFAEDGFGAGGLAGGGQAAAEGQVRLALVLGDPSTRAKKMREVMDGAPKAQERDAAGAKLTAEEQLLVRYLAALAKMQRSTVRRPE